MLFAGYAHRKGDAKREPAAPGSLRPAQRTAVHVFALAAAVAVTLDALALLPVPWVPGRLGNVVAIACQQPPLSARVLRVLERRLRWSGPVLSADRAFFCCFRAFLL